MPSKKAIPMEHRARKRFGQNFLHDPHIIRRIVQAVNAQPDDHLVEIGPGQGAITEGLITSGAQLDVIELDRDLIPGLLASFVTRPNFKLHNADALRFDFRSLRKHSEPLRIVGNLPYNISTPLIFHLLSYSELISDMHFMLQKEVVDRLAAAPDSRDYGRLSIMTQYFCQVQPLFDVPPGAFKPAPKVTSSVVRLRPFQQLPHQTIDYHLLEQVVRTAFSQRRKTLRNCLKTLCDDELLQSVGIDPQLRPENVPLPVYVSIANALAMQEQERRED
jgi:16S rRNA (adenine1518-N6/adenine1519-N6)-dimethyltransferase